MISNTCATFDRKNSVPNGTCRGCERTLPLTQKGSVSRTLVWCSISCSRWFQKNHDWAYARYATIKRDGEKFRKCDSTEMLEVNHIVPRRGGGYGFGCWNHLTNLETLCHWCHVEVTNAQRAEHRAAMVLS